MLTPRSAITAAALLTLTLCSCAQPRLRAPEPTQALRDRDQRELEELLRLGRDGDWLVVRGYHATDNFIANVRNAPFSHVAVLDFQERRVVESDASGVHITPLAAFVARSERLMLVRPMWSTPERGGEAVLRARALVGRPYDFTGLVGLDAKDRFYCSELAMAVWRSWAGKGVRFPAVIPPDQMHYWGRILYDSGAALAGETIQ